MTNEWHTNQLVQDQFSNAVETGDSNTLGSILAMSPDILHTTDKDGHDFGARSLFKAIWAAQDTIVDKILGGRPELIDYRHPKTHEGVLQHAVRRGNTQFLAWMLDHFPSVSSAVDTDGRSALHHAAADGRLEVLKLLVTRCPHLLSCSDKIGRTPLHAAIEVDRIGAVQFLLAIKQELASVSDAFGRSPMDYSTSLRYNEISELLAESISKNRVWQDKTRTIPPSWEK
jgi:ankyrin repeat protein